MEFSLTTPALLFPTVTLLLLAYTNRFVAIGTRIRSLHELYQKDKSESLLKQIKILRIRIRLIRDLQVLGIVCLFFCVLTMFLIFGNFGAWAKYSFGVSLILLMVSFAMTGWEVILSTKALKIQLKDIEDGDEGLMF